MPANFPNKIFLLPVVGALCFLAALSLFARFAPGIPLSVSQITTAKNDLFSVTGEGKAAAAPDIAQINLGVTANAATVNDAQNRANTIINKISADVKKLGVGDQDIRTTSYNLRPDYDYRTPGPQKVTGYTVDVNLLVKARQFDKINQIIDTATADGANQVGGLSFTLDDASREKLTALARKQAIDQAKSKAAEIAREAGLSLGRIVGVSESPQTQPRPVYNSSAPLAGTAETANPTQVEPGSSEISVSVTLSYETR